MRRLGRQAALVAFVGAILASAIVFLPLQPAAALEEGDTAPDFKLPSTTGADLGLADFAGKKWVFIEFYGLDFSPA